MKRPEDIHPALASAYNAGDLEALLALYDPKAAFVVRPGEVTTTPAELRAAMEPMVHRRARLTVQPESFVRSDDVVLVLGTFTLAGACDGKPFERTTRFADVLRRQPDGRWLIAVDHPIRD
jgi:uncharacterized protein (TIGR02246 family)